MSLWAGFDRALMVTTAKAESNKKKSFHDTKDKVNFIFVQCGKKKKKSIYGLQSTHTVVLTLEYDVRITPKSNWTETKLDLIWIKITVFQKKKILHNAADPSDGDLNILLTACIQKAAWNCNEGSSGFWTSGRFHCLGNRVLVGEVEGVKRNSMNTCTSFPGGEINRTCSSGPHSEMTCMHISSK